MGTYTVGMTEDRKWHCYQEDTEPSLRHLVGQGHFDTMASLGAEALIKGSENPWHGPEERYVFTCAVHAKSRHWAMKLAREHYYHHLIE